MHSHLPSLSMRKEDKSTKEAGVVTPNVTFPQAKPAPNGNQPLPVDSQVPPHIAERRSGYYYKQPDVLTKIKPQTLVDSSVPPQIVEGRFLQSYIPTSGFMTPKQNQNA